MSDFPATPATPSAFSTFSHFAGLGAMRAAGNSSAAAFNWVANLAIYVPVMLPWPYTVSQVFWANGTTVTSSNADFGIYTADGTRIYSTGSTAMSGTSTLQFVTPTAFQLSPGPYYFAWACSGTTGRGFGTDNYAAVTYRFGGVLQQTSALPLPATMTPAAVSNALYPLCGISRLASNF